MPRGKPGTRQTPEQRREYQRAYRARNLESRREARRRSMWKCAGMPEPTRPMPDNCECCGEKRGERSLCLDHDHATNEFRGWLCISCNAGIGSLGDTVQGVLAAANYLTRVSSHQ